MGTLGGCFADVGACLLVVFVHGEVLLRLVMLGFFPWGWWGRVVMYFDVPLDYGYAVGWGHFGELVIGTRISIL